MYNKTNNKKIEIDTLKLYLEEISKYPVLTEEEEKKLLKRVKIGDKQAKEEFINSNLRLVVFFAKKYKDRGLQYLDLIEEGNIGLLKALEKFEIEKNCKFSTYASFYIEAYIKNALLTKVRLIGIPTQKHKKLQKIIILKENLEKKLGREASNEELAEELNISLKEINLLSMYLKDTISLNEKITEDEEQELIEEIEDEKSGNIEDNIINSIVENDFYQLLKKILNKKELKVLYYRYGFYKERILTYQQIGDILGMSHQGVNQLERRIIKKLENNEKIKKYYKEINA